MVYGQFWGFGGGELMRCMDTIGLKYHFHTPLIIGPGRVVIHNSPNFGSPTLCLLWFDILVSIRNVIIFCNLLMETIQLWRERLPDSNIEFLLLQSCNFQQNPVIWS